MPASLWPKWIALRVDTRDGYERLVRKGWEEVAWEAQGGYGNRSAVGKANAKRERLWCSPHCVRERDLFG